MAAHKEAILSSSGNMTSFAVDDYVIRFRTSENLVRYETVLTWDAGYIECLATYANPDVTEEEYIDLIPILENLYFEPTTFLQGIDSVRVCYA